MMPLLIRAVIMYFKPTHMDLTQTLSQSESAKKLMGCMSSHCLQQHVATGLSLTSAGLSAEHCMQQQLHHSLVFS